MFDFNLCLLHFLLCAGRFFFTGYPREFWVLFILLGHVKFEIFFLTFSYCYTEFCKKELLDARQNFCLVTDMRIKVGRLTIAESDTLHLINSGAERRKWSRSQGTAFYILFICEPSWSWLTLAKSETGADGGDGGGQLCSAVFRCEEYKLLYRCMLFVSARDRWAACWITPRDTLQMNI